MKKDYCPGFWDLCSGGVVGDDEEDDINAMREVEEEVGLTVPLEKFNKIDTIKFDGERSKVFGNVYLLDGLELDPDNMKL